VTAAAWLIVSRSTYLAVLIKSEEEDGRNDGVGRKNALLDHRHHRTTRRPAARVRVRDQMKLCLSPDGSCRPSTCDARRCKHMCDLERGGTYGDRDGDSDYVLILRPWPIG